MADDSENSKCANEDNDESRIKLVYEIIKEAYKSRLENRDKLDEKASKIIVFSGIIVSLYSGFGSIILREMPKDQGILTKYNFLLLLLALGLILLICSVYFGLRAFKLETWKSVPDERHFLDEYAKKDKSKQEILGCLSTMIVEAVENNDNKIKNKVSQINVSFNFLLAGIVICVVFLLLSVLIY
jgi:hypothetical protein